MPDYDFDDKECISSSFDSDEDFDNHAQDDDDWYNIEICEPDICHTCHFIGHSRHKCPNIGKNKARNMKQHQYYSVAAEAINYKKCENTSQKKFSPHEPVIDHYGTIHEDLTFLLEERLMIRENIKLVRNITKSSKISSSLNIKLMILTMQFPGNSVIQLQKVLG